MHHLLPNMFKLQWRRTWISMIVADLTPGHQRLSCWDGPVRGYQLMSQYISCGTEERCPASWIGCPAHRGTTNSTALRINSLCLDISGYTMKNVFNKCADSVSVSQVYCFYFLYFTNIHLANMFQNFHSETVHPEKWWITNQQPKDAFYVFEFYYARYSMSFYSIILQADQAKKPYIVFKQIGLKNVTKLYVRHDDVTKLKHFRVTGPLCWEFPSQRPVTRSFDVFFDLRLNKSLRKQSCGWWF